MAQRDGLNRQNPWEVIGIKVDSMRTLSDIRTFLLDRNMIVQRIGGSLTRLELRPSREEVSTNVRQEMKLQLMRSPSPLTSR